MPKTNVTNDATRTNGPREEKHVKNQFSHLFPFNSTLSGRWADSSFPFCCLSSLNDRNVSRNSRNKSFGSWCNLIRLEQCVRMNVQIAGPPNTLFGWETLEKNDRGRETQCRHRCHCPLWLNFVSKSNAQRRIWLKILQNQADINLILRKWIPIFSL